MKKVLIIEDDIFLREMYVHTFERHGYEAFSAYDGEDGIKQAEKLSVDVILLDIMLPKKNGLEVLSVLRQPKSHAIQTPIILLTNLGQEAIINEAIKNGANGYILKADILPRQLIDRITSFLDGKIDEKGLRYGVGMGIGENSSSSN
ncbi:response regulator [candidate division WWE3 bacterium]|nr:response regulator [candidate division WWE3 bacterium]